MLVAPAAAAPLDGVTGVLLAVADSGQWAPVAFLCATMFAELVPLLPTQPISLAAGLLFGAPVGATLVLCGSTTACMCAYGLTKGPAKGLARWVMQKELKGPVPAALTGGKDLERGFPPAGDLEGGGSKPRFWGPRRGARLCRWTPKSARSPRSRRPRSGGSWCACSRRSRGPHSSSSA